MQQHGAVYGFIGIFAALVALSCGRQAVEEAVAPAADALAPGAQHYRVDPFWPQELPDNWLLGQVIGVAVDSRDHIWVLHRPLSLTPRERGAADDPPTADCCVPAPPVVEFDPAGNVVQAWGGPAAGYEWPSSEHGIFIDHKDNVWIGGNSDDAGLVLKFSRAGNFLLQIGAPGETGGSRDVEPLHSPADIGVDPQANEVYIADGQTNRFARQPASPGGPEGAAGDPGLVLPAVHRVIVFDADSGEYKRQWGAYGRPPDDGPLDPYDPNADPSPIFGDNIHCVVLSAAGLVYVCDRLNRRLQIFERDGTFLREGFMGRTLAGTSVWDIDFSHDDNQTFLYSTDGGNHYLWSVRREGLENIERVGRRGRNAGLFESPHSLAIDSQGNLYLGEIYGRRMQKFVPTGAAGL